MELKTYYINNNFIINKVIKFIYQAFYIEFIRYIIYLLHFEIYSFNTIIKE